MTATTRRAALTALASVPALALPGTAMAIAPGPSALDAELFQLIAAAREAEARFDASNDATEAARDRMGEVPVPQALIVTEGDTGHWAEVRPGDYFTRAQLSQIKHSWEQKQKRQLSRLWSDAIADSLHMASLSDKDRALIEMMAAQEVRQDQLVPAFDEWNEMRRLAEERSGVTAAEKLNCSFTTSGTRPVDASQTPAREPWRECWQSSPSSRTTSNPTRAWRTPIWERPI
jgi:hypothetical protein